MRKFKRLASMALAAVMTLAMCAPAFAVEGEEPKEPEVKYDVFQIFTGTYTTGNEYNGEVLGNIKWGQNGKYDEGTADQDTLVPEAVLNELKAMTGTNGADQSAGSNGKSDKEKLEVIEKYVNLNSEAYAKEKTLKEVKELTDVDPGYYLIRNTPGTVSNGQAYTTYVVQVTNGNFENLKPKTSVPEVEKTVESSSGQPVNVNSAAVGDELTFTLKGTLPSNLADYKTYFYKFTDTMSKGLALKEDSITIKIDDNDISSLFTISPESTDGSAETVLTITASDLLTSDKIYANGEIVVTYKAILTKDASMGSTPTENNVKLTYSNNPNCAGTGTPGPDNPDNPTGDTVEGEKTKTETYITGLTVTDFADGKPMTGAVFTLTGEGINAKLECSSKFELDNVNGVFYKLADGESYTKTAPTDETRGQYAEQVDGVDQKYTLVRDVVIVNTTTNNGVTATIDSNGALTIAGLNVGKYTLHQESAPAGYNLYKDIEWEIVFDVTTKNFGEKEDIEEVVCRDNWFYIDLNQGLGTLLPETGGIGTTLLYIAGILLIAGAGATFILKGKKEEDIA